MRRPKSSNKSFWRKKRAEFPLDSPGGHKNAQDQPADVRDRGLECPDSTSTANQLAHSGAQLRRVSSTPLGLSVLAVCQCLVGLLAGAGDGS